MATSGAFVGLTRFAHTRPLIQRIGRWVRLGLGCNARRGPGTAALKDAFKMSTRTRADHSD